jgi:hypothetical protein
LTTPAQHHSFTIIQQLGRGTVKYSVDYRHLRQGGLKQRKQIIYEFLFSPVHVVLLAFSQFDQIHCLNYEEDRMHDSKGKKPVVTEKAVFKTTPRWYVLRNSITHQKFVFNVCNYTRTMIPVPNSVDFRQEPARTLSTGALWRHLKIKDVNNVILLHMLEFKHVK